MSLLAWYKNWPFLRPRTYQLHYRVQLPTVRTDGWLLLPYPTTTAYQAVGQVDLQAAGIVEKHDYFYLLEQAGWAEWQCRVAVQPRQLDLREAQQLAVMDYATRPDGEYYCQPDNWIQARDWRILTIAAAYQKRYRGVVELLQALFNHTIETLQYGEPILGLYSTTQALERPLVDCGGFSTYLAALCRACQIPTRLIAGFWAGHPHNDMHAWIECLLPNGQWLALDPAVDYLRRHGRTSKIGGFNRVGSDRVVMNTGSQHELTIHDQTFSLGIIQTPLFIRHDGVIEYLKNYLVRTA